MFKKHKTFFVMIAILAAFYLFFALILPGCSPKAGDMSARGTEELAQAQEPAAEPPVETPPLNPTPQTPNTPPPAPQLTTKYAYVSCVSPGLIDIYNADNFTFVKKMGADDLIFSYRMCLSRATYRSGTLPKYLYVANANNVKRFDLETQLVDSGWGNAVAPGLAVRSVTISSDDTRLYSTEASAPGKLIITDIATKLDIARINPELLVALNNTALTPNNSHAVLSDGSPDYVDGFHVQEIKLSDNTALEPVITDIGRMVDVKIDLQGAYAYLTVPEENKVVVFHIPSRQVVGSVDLGDFPYNLAITPNGAFAYVSNNHGGNVSVLALDGVNTTELPARIAVGAGPMAPGISSDGKYVWVPCAGNKKVYVIQTSDNTVIQQLDTDANPQAAVVE